MEEALRETYALILQRAQDSVFHYAGAGIHLQSEIALEVHHGRATTTYGGRIRH